jgi:hypothetical protein
MKFGFCTTTAAILAVSLVASYGQTSTAKPPVKKHVAAKKVKTPPPPTVAEQIQALRHEMASQKSEIDTLKAGMAAKDVQLQKAEQAATNAQAAASRAEAAVATETQAASENAAAVTTLQSTVSGLKTSQSALATTFTDQTGKIQKAIDSPSVLHYKGVVFTPGGFLTGETAWRAHGTGGEMPTSFSTIPYEHADAYSLSEFFGSARQSRVSLLTEGKVRWGAIRAYIEADFLGVGTTSNENQSNSYILRQRLLYAQADTNSHWSFTAGQIWSLSAESKKSITSSPGDIAVPQVIDPNYLPGFIWSRQFAFRVVKRYDKVAFAVAAENAQILYSATLAGNTPYAVMGSAGAGGGLLNAAISSCSPATSVVNYVNVAGTVNGQTVNMPSAVSKTVNSCTNLANISFNKAPDMLIKAAFDPGFGHYEVFGIARFAHETIYPGETTNGYLYGGKDPNGNPIIDIKTGLAVAPALSAASSYSNSTVLGGVGASLRVPVVANKLLFGAKSLYGPGVGRYGDTNLPDLTTNARGGFAPIHNLSGLLTVEATPTSRLILWADYGGDYASRAAYLGGKSLAAPTATQNETSGLWGGTWATPKAAAVGYGSPLFSNAACLTTAAPGYNGSSAGYYAGSSCGAQTRAVQEITGGYWYDIYKGDRGRLRQAVQYGYVVREGWSGAEGIGAKGIENMFFTVLRYYLP